MKKCDETEDLIAPCMPVFNSSACSVSYHVAS